MPAKFCSAPQLSRLYKAELPKIKEVLERLIDKFLVADMDCGQCENGTLVHLQLLQLLL
ncbi:MAG: hypothetical protein WBC05_16075 [Sedimentisphaerales bacterium]